MSATFGLSGKAAKRLLRDGPDIALQKATREIWNGDKWKALDMLRTVATRWPKDPRTLYYCGLALYDLGSTVGPNVPLRDQSWDLAERFVAYAAHMIQREANHQHTPLLPLCYYNLAKFLLDRQLVSDALEHARDATRLNPGGPEGWGMRGDLEALGGDMLSAMECWRRAATVPTLNPESLYNRSFKRILLGDPGGHADYEQRFACPGYRASYHRDFWDGAAQAYPNESGRLCFHWLQGKRKSDPEGHHNEPIPDVCTLLVYAEQGQGDTIQTLRYLPYLRDRFNFRGPVVLEVHRELVGLAEQISVDHDVDVVARGDKLPGIHAHLSLMSLPFCFGGETLGGAAYLTAKPNTPPNPFGLRRVGLCWAGSEGHKSDWTRSMPFRHALPLAAVPGIEWVSVQWGHREAEAGQVTWLQRNHGRWRDMRETAEVIAGLDMLVTIDSSVAHLAGALGVPTVLMLPVVPDARWGLGTSTAALYDSVQILRQTEPNDWDGIIRRVHGILQQPIRRVA